MDGGRGLNEWWERKREREEGREKDGGRVGGMRELRVNEWMDVWREVEHCAHG